MNEFPNLNFNGLQLLEYCYKNGSEVIPIKLNDNFPKFFKFRSLDVLKNEVYLARTFEY